MHLNSLRRNRKLLGKLFTGLFIISLLFPITASVVNQENEVYITGGIFDVAVAGLCFILYVCLSTGNKIPADRASLQQLQHMNQYILSIPLLLIVLFLTGIQLNWQVLLVGLGWRSWLLAVALPYLLSIFNNQPAHQVPKNKEQI